MKKYQFEMIRDCLTEIEEYVERNTPVKLQENIAVLEFKITRLEAEITGKDKKIEELQLKVAQQGLRIGQLLPRPQEEKRKFN